MKITIKKIEEWIKVGGLALGLITSLYAFVKMVASDAIARKAVIKSNEMIFTPSNPSSGLLIALIVIFAILLILHYRVSLWKGVKSLMKYTNKKAIKVWSKLVKWFVAFRRS